MPLPMFSNEKKDLNIRSMIAIAAGKGGVGKSTMSVNLALALQLDGYSVGVVDADLYGPSLRKMLPEESPPYQKGDKIFPAKSKGIKFISLAHFQKENEAAVIRAPIANQLILQLIHKVDWGRLDYLLIDFPPGTGDIQLSLCQHVPLSGAILVTTPQEIALQDVRKAAILFKKMNIPLIGLIENMSYYQGDKASIPIYLFGEGGGGRLAEEMKVPLLGQIPIDPVLCHCCDQGVSIFDHPNALPQTKEVFRCCVGYLKGNQKMESILKKIWHKDESTLTIEWRDGVTQDFNLSILQKNCPCARCSDKTHENRLHEILDDLKAVSIENIGSYALKIQFSSGCSNGIYTFDKLREKNV